MLHTNPNLREMHTKLVKTPPYLLTEKQFWHNFFLRCNTICLNEGMGSYLEKEEKAIYSSYLPIASLQRLKNEVVGKTKRSAAEWEKIRKTFAFSTPWTVKSMQYDTMYEVPLGELDLDIDGEIERELTKRRPSRIAQMHLEGMEHISY